MNNKIELAEEIPDCICGCNKKIERNKNKINEWNLFVNGHNRRKKSCMLNLCRCGCGRYVKEGRHFVVGHAVKGKPMSDEVKKKIGLANKGNKGNKGYKHSEQYKKELSASRRGIGNPMYGRTFIHKEETKRKISEKNSGINNGMFGRGFLISGMNHPNWKGGISCEPYCDAWLDKEYKSSILERDNHQCQNPDCWGRSKRLLPHHIDYDKKNCRPSNLITLCISCNIRANSQRDFWRELYSQILQKEKTA